MAIKLSEYRRNGIFIEERNNSVLDPITPDAPNVHFVPGYTRKSTVFNRPILIDRPSKRKQYIGEIDRNLERKGSFFQRTVDVALQTAPVYAMPLLKTEDTDEYKIDYISLSTTAMYSNIPSQKRQYDDFFNKTGFWNKDTESFIYFAEKNGQMLHLTNLGDKRMTVFVFKDTNSAMEMTVKEWYDLKGEDIPEWLHEKDFISDYLIRVVAVRGDFTDYPALAVDPTYQRYFSPKGLRKDMIDNFLYDKAVTELADYRGSIIPYFRDMENNLMYIESLINNDTDSTGLFCAIDIDKIETDYNTGVVDLIGNTIPSYEETDGTHQEKIDFLSYNETITEVVDYDTNINDYGTDDKLLKEFNITIDTNNNNEINFTGINGVYGRVLRADGYEDVTLEQSPNLTGDIYDITTLVDGDYVVVVDDNNVLKVTKNTTYNGYVVAFFEKDSSGFVNPYVLGVNEYDSTTTTFVDYTITPSAMVDSDDFTNSNSGEILVYVNDIADNEYELRFNTANELPNKSNIVEYFAYTIKNLLLNNIKNNSYFKVGNNKYHITTNDMSDGFNSGYNYIHFDYNEEIFDNTITHTNIVFTDKSIVSLNDINHVGIDGYSTMGNGNGHLNVGKESKLVKDYLNGTINTGDYFYPSFGKMTHNVIFQKYEGTDDTNINIGDNLILMHQNDVVVQGGDIIIFDDEPNITYTISSIVENIDIPTDDFAVPIDYKALVVEENIDSGKADKIDVEMLNGKMPIYLRMFDLGDGEIHIDFRNESTLQAPAKFNDDFKHLSDTIRVYSGKADYTQSLEIESGWDVEIDNAKNRFLIDQTRYPRIKVGDYVRANTLDLGDLEYPNEMQRYFTRIIKKQSWSGNVDNGVNYAVITTDAEYFKFDANHGGGTPDWQTYRYTSIDEYVSTYKGFKLDGFRIKSNMNPFANHSNPQNAQNEVLSILEKDSPLYCAITDKQNFSFRYLIDSFGNGLREFSKQELADICGKRKNCIGFLNAPSAKAFRQSSSPSFINDDGTLNMEYVRKGGNEQQNPPFLYSFADGSGKDDGRDTVGYFFPYVTVNDNGRPLSFPPASYVANTYMRKNNSTIEGIYSFTVAAGTQNGIVQGIANTEMNFTEKHLEEADAMGLNLIMYHNTYGYYLNSEYTASIRPKSALSNLHVREILIDMENEMYAMLFKYQFQFNIASVRAKVKREADDICRKYMDRGAITYYENIINESNNTAELIDNQFGLLETTIVPVSAMAKIVNIFNITSNGALADSTGFSAQ